VILRARIVRILASRCWFFLTTQYFSRSIGVWSNGCGNTKPDGIVGFVPKGSSPQAHHRHTENPEVLRWWDRRIARVGETFGQLTCAWPRFPLDVAARQAPSGRNPLLVFAALIRNRRHIVATLTAPFRRAPDDPSERESHASAAR
jgi:hypothetical protein